MWRGSLFLLLILVGCASSGPTLVKLPPVPSETLPPVPLPPVEVPPPRDELVDFSPRHDYALGKVYPVQTRVNHTTVLLWPLGEFLYTVAGGEPDIITPDGRKESWWVVEHGVSGEGAHQRGYVRVTPRAPGRKTTLVVGTSRYVYVIEVTSGTGRYQPVVAFWSEPPVTVQRPTGPAIPAIGALGVGYDIYGPPDVALSWLPVQAWDTQRTTVIRFRHTLPQGEAPILYAVTPEGETQVINYQQYGAYYVADRLSPEWELRVGAHVVRLKRAEGYQVASCPGAAGCP